MDRLRLVSVLFAIALAGCDPGAGFHVEGAPDERMVWRSGPDSIVARVHANAFTINLTVAAEILTSSVTEFRFDTSTVVIRDRDGKRLGDDRATGACYFSTGRELARRCLTAGANLHATKYEQLDSMTVRFGDARLGGRFVPLVAVFRLTR